MYTAFYNMLPNNYTLIDNASFTYSTPVLFDTWSGVDAGHRKMSIVREDSDVEVDELDLCVSLVEHLLSPFT